MASVVPVRVASAEHAYLRGLGLVLRAAELAVGPAAAVQGAPDIDAADVRFRNK